MLLVPEASVPAVEMCYDKSVAGTLFLFINLINKKRFFKK
jgi:hypothetical protein